MWNVGQAVTTSIHSFTEMMKFAEKISTLSGIIARVAEVDEALQELDDAVLDDVDPSLLSDTAPHADEKPNSTAVQLNSCDIVTPTGVCLAQNVSLEVTPKSPLMVTGPNGCGKSSFFRVLGGLWQLQGGQVRIQGVASGSDGIFLVPQRIYCCLGTLADQVTYPVTYSAAERDSATTQRVLDLLDLVGVKYLAEREDGLDQTKVWEDVLSLGEQQRIGIARMYYARPVFGVLDEVGALPQVSTVTVTHSLTLVMMLAVSCSAPALALLTWKRSCTKKQWAWASHALLFLSGWHWKSFIHKNSGWVRTTRTGSRSAPSGIMMWRHRSLCAATVIFAHSRAY